MGTIALMVGMKLEVIYNQLVQEYADEGKAPFDELVVAGPAPGADVQHAV